MNLDAKEKAEKLFYKFFLIKDDVYNECRMHENEAKKCALIAVENEYFQKRELIYLLRSNHAIDEKVYLHFIQHLIDEEKEVKKEIEKL